MAKNTIERDIANAFGDAYSRSAHVILPDIHEFLFERTEEYLKKLDGEKIFLIIGPGPQVLPFSKSKERVRDMMDEGAIILMDYIFTPEKAKESARGLTKLGFFDRGYFRLGNISGRDIDPIELEPRTINYVKGDLRENLKLPDNSINCIDATLSIHHATRYGDELDRITAEVYRVLKDGGMFHFGTGNVDMKYNERKINKIVGDLEKYLGKSVSVLDNRDDGYRIEKNPAEDSTRMIIDNQGILHIPDLEGLVDYLQGEGYNLISAQDKEITLKLIDPQLSEDREGLIVPVDRYYDAIQTRVDKGYESGSLDTKLVSDIGKGIVHERSLAQKGLTEYYTGEQRILESLTKAGFRVGAVKHHETEPFYNIVARKPVSNHAGQ